MARIQDLTELSTTPRVSPSALDVPGLGGAFGALQSVNLYRSQRDERVGAALSAARLSRFLGSVLVAKKGN